MYEQAKMMIAALLKAKFNIDLIPSKDGKSNLSTDERSALVEKYGEDFTAKFISAFDKELSNPGGPTLELTTAQADLATAQTDLATAQADLATAQADISSSAVELTAANNKVTNLQTEITKLAGLDLPPPPAGSGNSSQGAIDHSIALYGQTTVSWQQIEGRPWNSRARSALMATEGFEIAAVGSVDYSALEADLGAYFRERKMDDIVNLVPELTDVSMIFPLEYGHLDQAVLTTLFSTQFSQAFQEDFVPQGGFSFEAEILQMYNVGVDHEFKNMKDLEKQWIGYLSKPDGSKAIKMGFVEWLIIDMFKKMHNEQQIRRIRGTRIEPTQGTPGLSINAADGVQTYISKKIDELKVIPFLMSTEFAPLSLTNVVDYIFEMVMKVPQQFRDTGNLATYIPSDLKIFYDKQYNQLYGNNNDYSGPESDKVKFIQSMKVIGIPYSGNSARIFITIEGNIKLFEFKAGEMFGNISWNSSAKVLTMDTAWKEGVCAIGVGKKRLSAVGADFSEQVIWVNDERYFSTYFLPINADDTTPSVAQFNQLITGVNTAATVITDIDDMAIGTYAILKCGSDDANKSTISATLIFDEMTADWTPEFGDTITLFKRAAGEIIDVKRTTAATGAIEIAADDDTPDVAAGLIFITQTNTVPTIITNLDNATADKEYTIHGGSDTNSSTIADGGNFDLDDSEGGMTLSDGSFIRFYASTATGSLVFMELERG